MQRPKKRRVSTILGLLLLSLGLPFTAYAQRYLINNPPSGNIIIKNVVLPDRSGETEDLDVTLRIQDGVLDLVTQDTLRAAESDLILNANNGVLLGDLNLGEAPSFMILDSDPREDFEVLLDTALHTQFAMHQGKMVRNNLEPVALPESVPATRRRGWFAYTPPPVSLPVAYRNRNKWNRFDTNWAAGAFIGALLVDRQYWPKQDDASESQVGDLDEFEEGEIRALRFGLVGRLGTETPIIYSLIAATNAFDKGVEVDDVDDFVWNDWRLDVPVFFGTTLSVGKQKEPFSMERLMSLANLPLQERTAAADALLPARNTGVVWSGNALGQDVSWALSAFRAGLDPDTNLGYSESPKVFVGRVTGVPYESPDRAGLVHLGLGVRYSDAALVVQLNSAPEFNLAPNFIDTGPVDADEAYTYNLEAAWRQGPLWLMGEYLLTDIDAPDLDDPNLSSYYLQASYTLTGEMREYNRRSGVFRPLRVARSVNQFGWGTWELAARYSRADFTDGAIDGGEMDIYSLGLNWWLTTEFSFGVNYRFIVLDRFGDEGDSAGISGRLTLLLN